MLLNLRQRVKTNLMSKNIIASRELGAKESRKVLALNNTQLLHSKLKRKEKLISIFTIQMINQIWLQVWMLDQNTTRQSTLVSLKTTYRVVRVAVN